MGGQLLETARVVRLDPQQAQLQLGRRPCQIHGPVDGMGIAILVHQSDDLFPGFARGQNQRNLDPLTRTQVQALPQAQDGVEDESPAVAGFLKSAHGPGERSAATDETATVGLEPQVLIRGLRRGEAVGDINGRVVSAAWTAVGQERPLFRQGLGPDEQLVERRMLTIRTVRRQREFHITRQIETAAAQGTIDQRHPSNLDVVFR